MHFRTRSPGVKGPIALSILGNETSLSLFTSQMLNCQNIYASKLKPIKVFSVGFFRMIFFFSPQFPFYLFLVPPSPFLPAPPPLFFSKFCSANALDGLHLWGTLLKLVTHSVGLLYFSRKQIIHCFSQMWLLTPCTFYVSQALRHAVETV